MRSPHRWRAVTLWTFALALAVLPIDVVAQTAEPVRASTGMVVSQHWLASEVGRDVLAAGGTAIDAAIATGFA